jgi:hypothetical protein
MADNQPNRLQDEEAVHYVVCLVDDGRVLAGSSLLLLCQSHLVTY